MSDTTGSRARMVNGVFWAALGAVIIYMIVRHIGVLGNVLIVLLGFGTVVLVHEFGHFIVAKLSGIRVEAFSIFMPPTLLGIRKSAAGWRFRFLPSLASEKEDESAERSETTEYRIGIFPFGGYVKLLGQEDTGPVKQVDDPRSFARKSIGTRIAVISAGVTFNVISAALIFIAVFLLGIRLAPPVIGGVVPGSPAAQAGLRAGDVVTEIAGATKDLDFSNIIIASALSDAGKAVPMSVRHADGTTERVSLVAKELPGSPLREFGIVPPTSLTVAKVGQPGRLYEQTGLRSGDRFVGVDGKEVQHYWDFVEAVRDTLAPEISTKVERRTDNGGTELVDIKLPLDWAASESADMDSDSALSQIYSMVPRLRVAAVEGEELSAEASSAAESSSRLRTGDIIVAAGQTDNPTYKEVRDMTNEYEGKVLPLKVLRTDANGVEQVVAVSVKPRRERRSDRVIIGFVAALDARHAVVAKTISTENGVPPLDIPRGARIIAVGDKPVSSFYDVIEQVRQWGNQSVALRYQVDSAAEGGVTLPVGQAQRPITVRSVPAKDVPLAPLEQLYQARGPVQAIAMGYRRTVMFIAQTYVTLKQLLSGLISPKHLMGPVGIISVSYRIVAEQPLVNYAYFLALISATIAVLNFLPIPPFDGGLVVLMLIEKIRGVALSERAQGIVAYTGWALILALLVYVTFNDVVRTFFS